MKKKDFYFESRDNHSKVHAVRWLPDDENIKAILVVVHGMAEYIERYEGLAKFFTDRGYLVTGIDNLGHGKSIRDDKNPGYFAPVDPATVVVRDVHRLKKLTQEEYQRVPIAILGHSMGSFIVRNYIIRYGTGVDCAVIMGTGAQPSVVLGAGKTVAGLQKLFMGDNHKSNLLNGMAFGSYLKRIPNKETPFDWLSVDKENVKKYIADPLCGFTFPVNGFRTLFELIKRCQDPGNISKIPENLPILVIAGKEDPVGNYGKGPESVYKTYEKAGIKDVELVLYDGLRHEIMNEAEKENVFADIFSFVDSRTCK